VPFVLPAIGEYRAFPIRLGRILKRHDQLRTLIPRIVDARIDGMVNKFSDSTLSRELDRSSSDGHSRIQPIAGTRQRALLAAIIRHMGLVATSISACVGVTYRPHILAIVVGDSSRAVTVAR
jgi:hypothetical protein